MRGGVGDVQGDEGAARQAAAGVARRGAVAVFSSAFWQEEEDAPALGGLGQLAGLPAGPARWAAGEITLSLSLNSVSVFYLCYFVLI